MNERLEEIAELCGKGAEILLPELSAQIKKLCENAVRDKNKGPYYALEIIKACLSKLSDADKSVEQQMMTIDDDVSHEEKLLAAIQKKLKITPNFMAAKQVESYVSHLKEYMKYRFTQLTGNIIMDFYKHLYSELDKYAEESLRTRSYVFDLISEHMDEILNGESQYMGFGVNEAFDPLDPQSSDIRAALDKMVDSIPSAKLELAMKRADLLTAAQNGVTEFISELLVIVDICVGDFTEKGYDAICKYFNISNSLSWGMEHCFGRVNITTPTTNGTPLTRVICPSTAKPEDIAPLRSAHKELNDIWNASASSFSVSVIRIQGAVKLEEFDNYTQWENMRYAYVNDSLKKHGIHIFG